MPFVYVVSASSFINISELLKISCPSFLHFLIFHQNCLIYRFLLCLHTFLLISRSLYLLPNHLPLLLIPLILLRHHRTQYFICSLFTLLHSLSHSCFSLYNPIYSFRIHSISSFLFHSSSTSYTHFFLAHSTHSSTIFYISDISRLLHLSHWRHLPSTLSAWHSIYNLNLLSHPQSGDETSHLILFLLARLHLSGIHSDSPQSSHNPTMLCLTDFLFPTYTFHFFTS